MSMPCIGQVSFLPAAFSNITAQMIVCQCPVSGKSHFYLQKVTIHQFVKIVSMPCIGQVSFLQHWQYLAYSLGYMCQCPVSGKSHFYEKKAAEAEKKVAGVNALYRASLISTLPSHPEQKPRAPCVNALYRASLISTMRYANKDMVEKYVSMPCIGQVSFLQFTKLTVDGKQLCVNALYRASLISTLLQGSRNLK